MLAWMVGAVALVALQGAQDPQRAREAPEKVRVRTDRNGWPVATGREQATAQKPEPAPSGGARPPADARTASRDAAPKRATSSLDSPLLDVFRAVGSVADWKEMRGVMARIRIHVFDHRGAEIGVREVLHQADVTVPDRDRLVFEDERKVYARDGAAVWVELHGMAWPSLEDEARDELELFGLMLRLPWALADTRRWTVLPEEQILVDGEPRVRVRALRKEDGSEDDGVVGPDPTPPRGARVDLLCDPATMQPVELRYVLRPDQLARRVLLADVRPFGALRTSVRRRFVDPRGRARLELEYVRVDGKLDLDRSLFRPGGAGGSRPGR